LSFRRFVSAVSLRPAAPRRGAPSNRLLGVSVPLWLFFRAQRGATL